MVRMASVSFGGGGCCGFHVEALTVLPLILPSFLVVCPCMLMFTWKFTQHKIGITLAFNSLMITALKAMR